MSALLCQKAGLPSGLAMLSLLKKGPVLMKRDTMCLEPAVVIAV